MLTKRPQARTTIWVDVDVVEAFQLHPVEGSTSHWKKRGLDWLGLSNVDSIDYYTSLLKELNASVQEKQRLFLQDETSVLLPRHKPGTRSDAIKVIKFNNKTAITKLRGVTSSAKFDLTHQEEALHGAVRGNGLSRETDPVQKSHFDGSISESDPYCLSMKQLEAVNEKEMRGYRELKFMRVSQVR